MHEFRRSALTKIREAGFQGLLADWLAKVKIEDKSFAREQGRGTSESGR